MAAGTYNHRAAYLWHTCGVQERVNKQHILNEIRRTATENGGLALGPAAFENQTGIKESDWAGRHWARWSEAVNEKADTCMSSAPMIRQELKRTGTSGSPRNARTASGSNCRQPT